MRLSAHRIRSINRSIARVNGIICGASDKARRAAPENQKTVAPVSLGSVVRIVAVPKAATP
jgi:hypothetical protein